jgi:hypothetical protein
MQQLFPHVGTPTWSDTNAILFVVDWPTGIQSLDITTGERQLLLAVDGPVRDMAVSPDGTMLAAGLNQNLALVPLVGDASPVYVAEADYVDRVVWLPDSSAVLAGVSSSTSAGAHLEEVLRDGSTVSRVADIADASAFDVQPSLSSAQSRHTQP